MLVRSGAGRRGGVGRNIGGGGGRGDMVGEREREKRKKKKGDVKVVEEKGEGRKGRRTKVKRG